MLGAYGFFIKKEHGEKTLVLSLAGHLITDALTGFYEFIESVVDGGNNKKSKTLLEIEDTLKKDIQVKRK